MFKAVLTFFGRPMFSHALDNQSLISVRAAFGEPRTATM
jgi:hypothetical protein